METLADYYNFILVVELFLESVPEPFILKMYLNTAVTKKHEAVSEFLRIKSGYFYSAFCTNGGKVSS